MKNSGTKIATAIADGDASSAAARLIERLKRDLDGREPALVMAFASTAQPLDEILGPLTAAFETATVLGASTAGEFNESTVARGSTSAIAIAGDMEVHAGIGRGLAADPERAVAEAASALPRSAANRPHRTALLLLDPLAGVSEEATMFAATALSVDTAIPLAGGRRATT